MDTRKFITRKTRIVHARTNSVRIDSKTILQELIGTQYFDWSKTSSHQVPVSTTRVILANFCYFLHVHISYEKPTTSKSI